jgi:WD40 repeat protein
MLLHGMLCLVQTGLCVCLCVDVQDVLYSSDGSQVLSCSSDGTVRIWDAKTCEQLHGFRYVCWPRGVCRRTNQAGLWACAWQRAVLALALGVYCVAVFVLS